MKKFLIISALAASSLSSCKYLDVVPDNVATIEYAFRTPFTTEQYLFTCYSNLPAFADINSNPALAGGDEMWFLKSRYADLYRAYHLSASNINIVDPIFDYWKGEQGGKALWKGISECNIFLENIDGVYGLQNHQKLRMAAEAKFLRAYYHFYLLRMYGPIPIFEKNVPIYTTPEEVKAIVRQPIDKVFEFIEKTMDEAIVDLPDFVDFDVNELGRVTKPIALAIKAQILVTAASPLFNGNTEFSFYKNASGVQLFNQTKDESKWIKAEEACLAALEASVAIGNELNYAEQTTGNKESPETLTQLSFRTAITLKWNKEIIWGSTNSRAASIQTMSYPRLFSTAALYYGGEASVPMHIADKFYTKNGVPIDEDIDFDYNGRFDLQTAVKADQYNLQSGYQTAKVHFNRESRFYASLGFDGGRWYGQGRTIDDNLTLTTTTAHYVNARSKGIASGHAYSYSITGYYPKKLVNHLNPAGPSLWTVQQYPWPIMRLADLYLLYAEASNEVKGPNEEVYKYLNLIRERANLPTIQDAWTNHSRNPGKFLSKDGLREIIHRERTIELAFEGSRFWDVRRWKTAQTEFNRNIVGWDLSQEAASAYYRQVVIDKKTFQQKDYFFPVEESEVLKNRAIMQSPGWQL